MVNDTSKILIDKKILVVEDDVLFAKLLSTRFESMRCAYTVVSNGEDAIVEINKALPDVLVLDLMLPGEMNGFDVLEKIKSNTDTKHIPVIIVSNLGEIKDIERGMSLGAFRYLVKALVTIEEIIENIGSAVTSSIK